MYSREFLFADFTWTLSEGDTVSGFGRLHKMSATCGPYVCQKERCVYCEAELSPAQLVYTINENLNTRNVYYSTGCSKMWRCPRDEG